MKKQNKIASLAALIAEGGYVEHDPTVLVGVIAPSPWSGYKGMFGENITESSSLFPDTIDVTQEAFDKITDMWNKLTVSGRQNRGYIDSWKKRMSELQASRGRIYSGGGNYIGPIRHGAVIITQPHHRPRVKIIYNHGKPLFYHADLASDCVDKLMNVIKERLQ